MVHAGALSVSASTTPNATDEGIAVSFHASVAGGLAPYNLTWGFSQGGGPRYGAWVNRSFGASPNATATVWANDSARGSASTSVLVIVNNWPSAGIDAPSSTDVGAPTHFLAVPYGGTSPYAFQWLFGDGSRGVGVTVNHTYSTSGTFSIGLFDNDSVGASVYHAERISVLPGLSSASLVASPAVLDLGDNLTLNTTVVGGTPAYNYTYVGLPQGCASLPLALLTCAPNATGSFSVTVTVRDHAGGSLSASSGVQVNADPAIASFSASPSVVAEGSALSFSVQLIGGSGGIHLSYTGLPAGCASANTTSLVCAPARSGNFTIGVLAQDGRGRSTGATTTVDVTPPQGPGGGGNPSGNGSGNSTPSHRVSTPPWSLVADVALVLALGALIVLWKWGPPLRGKSRGPPPSKGHAAAPQASASGQGRREGTRGAVEEEDLDAPVD